MGTKITKIYPGSYYCNTYIIGNEGEPCIVVDPGCNNNSSLDRYIDKHHGGILSAILLTHGHFDHIGGLETLQHKAPIYVHIEDEAYLDDPYLNGSTVFGLPEVLINKEEWEIINPSDNEEFLVNGITIKAMHTPFHTKGSLIYYIKDEGALLTGDTLFHLGIGRSDLPGACPRLMPSSLTKIRKLPPETKIYPGHQGSSTLMNEFMFNSYLKNI